MELERIRSGPERTRCGLFAWKYHRTLLEQRGAATVCDTMIALSYLR